jgi:NADH:ubiquinone reductase (H+-translocating)
MSSGGDALHAQFHATREDTTLAKRILVIGAGFAGMWSALAAAREVDNAGCLDGEVEIMLIAPEPVLHMRPRLYEKSPGLMKTPLMDIFAAVGVKFKSGLVERIFAHCNEVSVRDSEGACETLSYDRLVIASGSRLFRPDIPGLDRHAFSIDQLSEAEDLDRHLQSLAGRPGSPARNTVVVAGGGFTGIELATELPDRLRDILGEGETTQVIMVEQASEIGPDLGSGPRPVIMQALEELGVTWIVNTAVTGIEADAVTLSNGQRIDTCTVIWTAGLRASPLTLELEAERDVLGRLHVGTDLRVDGYQNIFATGDTARAATDAEGNHALMSCQHAMNLGRYAGHNVAADLLGRKTLAYSQPKYVTCLDLGSWGAVYTEGWEREVKLQGQEAKELKHKINSEWIYPPTPNRADILASADPARLVVA